MAQRGRRFYFAVGVEADGQVFDSIVERQIDLQFSHCRFQVATEEPPQLCLSVLGMNIGAKNRIGTDAFK